jgi:NAD(P)-dependent dehydrogenase (short-subunit alcohol dehydrogenase family)/cytochrome P450
VRSAPHAAAARLHIPCRGYRLLVPLPETTPLRKTTKPRVVLVVGASSGIGLAAALQFAARGDRLILVSRSPEALELAAAACRDAGASEVDPVAADVTDRDGIEAAVRGAVAAHGRIDVVVLTAAVMAYGTVDTVAAEIFEKVVATAVFGTANAVRAVLPQFRRAGGGTLIVVNSLLGSVTVPRMGAYAVAKWGQRALVRTLAQEVRGERGIKVCMVSPGSINTPIYYQAANSVGRQVRPPLPVLSPERAGAVIAKLADRPRSHVSVPVGPGNPAIISGFRLLPYVYDRIVAPLFQFLAVTRRSADRTSGNVLAPRPEGERLHGHWPEPAVATDRCPYGAGTATHAAVDRSAGLLRSGYPYLLDLRRRWHTATAEIRLLGRRTTVVSGPLGVQLFYNEAIMRRRGAIPSPLQRTLFGKGAVHGLDDAEHKHRKAMFLVLLTVDAAREIAAEADARWRACGPEHAGHPAGLFDEAVTVHCAAVCRWAGVPDGSAYPTLAADLIAVVDGFGSLGARHLQARRARHRADRWSRQLVRRVRSGRCRVEPGSALDVIARHRDRAGNPLPAAVAGVELLNVLRPTVAVAYFVAFTAHALQTQPGLRTRLEGADDGAYEALASEVRRFYPFVPMLAARVRRPVTFQGRRLPRGRRVILDVYGTLHDPQLWSGPERFDIERFAGIDPDPYLYVPQGGADPATGHRCPGERATIELIKTAARVLVDRSPSERDAPRIPMNRMPTRPLS